MRRFTIATTEVAIRWFLLAHHRLLIIIILIHVNAVCINPPATISAGSKSIKLRQDANCVKNVYVVFFSFHLHVSPKFDFSVFRAHLTGAINAGS